MTLNSFCRPQLSAIACALSLLILLGLSTAEAQSQKKKPAATPSNTKLVSTGQSQFLVTCSGCHGPHAEGGDGPNLHHQGLTEAFINNRVTTGVPDEMPAFKRFTPSQVAAVTAYILSLQ